MSVPVGDSQALDEVGRVQEVSEDEPALDLGAVWDNLPAHYIDCDRFEVYNYGTHYGKCDCTAPADIPALIAEVERLTVERDQARDIACHLEQQAAEALRVAQEALNEEDADAYGQMVRAKALRQVVRILGDETENQ